MLGAPHPPNIDAVEQHRELGRVHLDRSTILGEARRSESPALQPLVIENEPASIPKQNLAAIATAPQEHEQVSGKEVHFPLTTHDAAQAIVAPAEIDWLNRQVDAYARR